MLSISEFPEPCDGTVIVLAYDDGAFIAAWRDDYRASLETPATPAMRWFDSAEDFSGRPWTHMIHSVAAIHAVEHTPLARSDEEQTSC
jgi:hypothetical protein